MFENDVQKYKQDRHGIDPSCTIRVAVSSKVRALGSMSERHRIFLFLKRPHEVVSTMLDLRTWTLGKSLRAVKFSDCMSFAKLTASSTSLPSSTQCSTSSLQCPAHPHPVSASHMPSSIHQVYSKWLANVLPLSTFLSSMAPT